MFLLSATSVNMPAYQPKKKTLDDFLAKLQNQKRAPSKEQPFPLRQLEQPLPLRQLEQPQQVELSSEVDQFRDKFVHHFHVQGPRGRSHREGANTGRCVEHSGDC